MCVLPFCLCPFLVGCGLKILHCISCRPDGHQNNLRSSAYESLMEIVKNSAKDCYPAVQKTTLVIMERLQQVLQMEVSQHLWVLVQGAVPWTHSSVVKSGACFLGCHACTKPVTVVQNWFTHSCSILCVCCFALLSYISEADLNRVRNTNKSFCLDHVFFFPIVTHPEHIRQNPVQRPSVSALRHTAGMPMLQRSSAAPGKRLLMSHTESSAFAGIADQKKLFSGVISCLSSKIQLVCIIGLLSVCWFLLAL